MPAQQALLARLREGVQPSMPSPPETAVVRLISSVAPGFPYQGMDGLHSGALATSTPRSATCWWASQGAASLQGGEPENCASCATYEPSPQAPREPYIPCSYRASACRPHTPMSPPSC